MLNIALIGFGFMGRMHYDNYMRLAEEGYPLRLVAICDPLIEELKLAKTDGNIATGKDVYDLSSCRLYTNVEEMLREEQLHAVNITVPTYLHADLTCNMLERGLHVLCEKPIARHASEGRRMADTAARTGNKLMIGQCLRFWPAYQYLKQCVQDNRFGQVTGGYFFRGGGKPKGWFLEQEKGGGCLLDMHIHDTDMIQWLFGKPEQVSTLARNVIPGSGYDIVSTHYVYSDGKVLNAQADWTLEGDFGFAMTFRVNFERGNLVFENNQLKVNPQNETGFIAELSPEMGYYHQIVYFADAIIHNRTIEESGADSATDSLEIIEAELRSADQGGQLVKLA